MVESDPMENRISYSEPPGPQPGVSCCKFRVRPVEATRLSDPARAAAHKIERTKNIALYYLLSRALKKIEGQQFTLRVQKNSQDLAMVPGVT